MLVRRAKKRIEVGNAGVAEERKLFEWEYVGRGGSRVTEMERHG